VKVGDLVQVIEPRACGGIDNGRIGLVTQHLPGWNPAVPERWIVDWIPSSQKPLSTCTFGKGIEVINEAG